MMNKPTEDSSVTPSLVAATTTTTTTTAPASVSIGLFGKPMTSDATKAPTFGATLTTTKAGDTPFVFGAGASTSTPKPFPFGTVATTTTTTLAATEASKPAPKFGLSFVTPKTTAEDNDEPTSKKAPKDRKDSELPPVVEGENEEDRDQDEHDEEEGQENAEESPRAKEGDEDEEEGMEEDEEAQQAEYDDENEDDEGNDDNEEAKGKIGDEDDEDEEPAMPNISFTAGAGVGTNAFHQIFGKGAADAAAGGSQASFSKTATFNAPSAAAAPTFGGFGTVKPNLGAAATSTTTTTSIASTSKSAGSFICASVLLS